MPEDKALKGIRVLDFTRLLAGPYATRLLADFGAEVIKVQSSHTAVGAEDNGTGYFATWNRNKLSITLNMNYPEARDLVLKLSQKCDVIIENFTPRVKHNWHLDYETFKRAKPDIIMLSMSGFGQTGPFKDYAALGQTVQAFSGLTRLTSYNKEQPMVLGNAYSDVVSGIYAAFLISAALDYRGRTGKGQYIDLSEYEAMCSMMEPALLDYTVNSVISQPQGNSSSCNTSAPCGCYRCSGTDRWCVIAVESEEEWHTLCRIAGHPEWAALEEFRTAKSRLKHEKTLNKLIEKWTVLHSPEEITRLLQDAGIAAGTVNNAADLAGDPHLKDRGFFVKMEHPVLGDMTCDGTAIRLSGTPAAFEAAAPLIGEHNTYVFGQLLGMSENDILDYRERGIIS